MARLRGIRAARASGAPGRSSHNPPVVGSSPTRPTWCFTLLDLAFSERVYDHFVGADAFLLAGGLAWFAYCNQIRNMLVSATRPSHPTAEQPRPRQQPPHAIHLQRSIPSDGSGYPPTGLDTFQRAWIPSSGPAQHPRQPQEPHPARTHQHPASKNRINVSISSYVSSFRDGST